MLSVEHLTFHYDSDPPVLRDLSLTIRGGAITTLMGANGCGKSTLLQILTKNLKPDSGSILLEGSALDGISLREFARKAAIVHQKNTAPDDLTVERLVAYGRLPYSSIFKAGLDQENQKQVERALALTDLTELRERRIGTLSGGQRQRAFIAMALAQNTKLLFLDEPTTFLDVRYQVEILRLVERLNKEEGITIVMVLHDINQALAYSDEVIGLLDGQVSIQGPPDQVITTESIQALYGIDLPVIRAEGKLCVMAV
ncbi:ABC transporter ATP-binding protein [Intestinimonas butyriciproducens]|uniref:Heme transporter analogous to IsdDEF, ATP-binding protein n=1 Tax=Intestinimonas butyriciproducens TaxID=1297617 RepID=A0A0S2W4U3_9FIRM|nr:ABC transporter ATP-binding protein [Intestinimonas butyriciproducens]ALP94287.1 Heme transporter analogous to IsdDEF, ATP-binding protein [Intestinimonas butyriciproducens]